MMAVLLDRCGKDAGNMISSGQLKEGRPLISQNYWDLVSISSPLSPFLKNRTPRLRPVIRGMVREIHLIGAIGVHGVDFTIPVSLRTEHDEAVIG